MPLSLQADRRACVRDQVYQITLEDGRAIAVLATTSAQACVGLARQIPGADRLVAKLEHLGSLATHQTRQRAGSC